MGLALLEAPAAFPVAVGDVQTQVRSTDPTEVPYLEALIAAATGQAEEWCRRRFISQKWRQTFDAFPARELVVAHPALISVQSVKYVNSDGVLTTIDAADYVVRTAELPGEIVPAYGKCWPSPRCEEDAVRVEFTCGYGAADDVPAAIKHAILLLCGTLYTHRESVVVGTIATPLPQSAEWLLGPHRVARQAA